MANLFSSLNKKVLKVIRLAGSQAEKNRCTAYLVGGFVRDLILKRKNLDIDIVVESDGISFARQLARKTKGTLKTYPRFKTATVFLPDGLRVDCATARRESYPFSGALPVVEDGSIHDDLFRRDFTINAMAAVINPDRFAELVDDFSGLADLKERKIRILHDQSFIDDPTRILRAIRFQKRFNLQIEERTLKLLKQALRSNAAGHVKPPRYFVEFKKILNEVSAAESLRQIADFKKIGFTGWDLPIHASILEIARELEDTISYFRKKTSREMNNFKQWIVFLIALLDSSTKPAIDKVIKRLNFELEAKKQIILSKDFARVARRLSNTKVLPHQIYRTLKPFGLEVLIYFFAKSKNKNMRSAIEHFICRHRFVTLSINGRDLNKIGIPSGIKMGKILERILDAKIDKKVHSRREEIQMARQLV